MNVLGELIHSRHSCLLLVNLVVRPVGVSCRLVLLKDLLGLEEVLMLTDKLVQDTCSLDHLGLLLLMLLNQLDHLMILLSMVIRLARGHLVSLRDGDQLLRLKLIS